MRDSGKVGSKIKTLPALTVMIMIMTQMMRNRMLDTRKISIGLNL